LTLDKVGAAPDIEVLQGAGNEFYRRTGKRIFDVTVVLFAAAIWVPLYLLLAGLILLLDGRPIHHKAARVGAGGRDIEVLKFRTMRPGAASELTSLLAGNPELHQEFTETFKLRDDPRITRLGAILRRFSLDELPQLANVLRGDMSLVGPRPVVRPELDAYYGASAPRLLTVRPGLTGLWQVSGRSLLSYDDRVALDLDYVDNHSFLLDVRVLLRTVPSVFRGHGAF
jgi:exopolysaccharide production protein ExoY